MNEANLEKIAMARARKLLSELTDASKTPELSWEIRDRARIILHHFPSTESGVAGQHLIDPLLLKYREFIRTTIRKVVLQSESEPEQIVRQAIVEHIPEVERESVSGILMQRLNAIHEGQLAIYRPLTLEDYWEWRKHHPQLK